MKLWGMSLVVALFMLLPAAADEVQKEEPQDEEATEAQVAETQKAEEKERIPQLAELKIDENVVAARMINLPFPGRTKTLQEILERLEEWEKDEDIGAVLLDIGYVSLSLPDVQELQLGIERLKKTDKKVMAYLHAGGANAYLLACSADEIAMAPSSMLVIPGLGALFPFMKGHYQMQGLEFDVITAGRYKYPGFVNQRQPNQYFQEEIKAIYDSWFGDYKSIIAAGRKLSEEAVSNAIDIAVFGANEAQQRGLIDTLAYYDEYRDRLLQRHKMKRYHGREEGLAKVNSLQDLIELVNKELKKAEEARKAVGPKIAVLHARGPIIDLNLGPSFASMVISREAMVKVIDELRKNKSIKAVVMRVDSPGGSGYASDMIWQALRRLDETKPLVVSMGRVAGSGGYYIACPARRIFAQPTTITGSIGVLGIFESAWSMFNRLDYELSEMQRGARALLGAPNRELSKPDRAFIQKLMDDFYDIFIDRVAQTRKMPAEEVRKIAEGRIWSGRDALKIGLVDDLGGLSEAIEAARTLANIPPSAELRIVHYPRPSSLGELLADFSSVSAPASIETFMKATGPAPSLSFDDQLMMFSQRVQPLCWMAVPDFWGAGWNRQNEGLSPLSSPATVPAWERAFAP
jgi:protease-4